MNPTYDFAGQVAQVTGASSGMGLATAQAFAESGAAVTLADINEQALQEAEEHARREAAARAEAAARLAAVEAQLRALREQGEEL